MKRFLLASLVTVWHLLVAVQVHGSPLSGKIPQSEAHVLQPKEASPSLMLFYWTRSAYYSVVSMKPIEGAVRLGLEGRDYLRRESKQDKIEISTDGKVQAAARGELR